MAAFIAYVFHIDPLEVLRGGLVDLAIRLAAANRVAVAAGQKPYAAGISHGPEEL